MNLLKTRGSLLTAFILTSIALQFTTQAQNEQLTFTQVYEFGEPRILQRLPTLKGWLDDEHYLQMKREDDGSYLMKINAATGEESVFVNYTEINENLPEGLDAARPIDVTTDYTRFLFTRENDLFYYSVLSNEIKKLTDTEATENNSTFSPDGKRVAFTREHNLFVINVESGVEIQLTFDGSEIIYNGWASWVYWEEILGRASNYKAFWWAPNSQMISFLRFDDSPVPKFPLFIADGVHGELEWAHYPKAGDPNPNVKLGVVNIKENKLVWVDEDETVDQYTAWPFWAKDSDELFYQILNRGQDTLQILAADPTSGKNRIVYTEVQPTWVNFFEDIYMFENNSGFILRSDKNGWRHLYYYDMQGNLINKITEGNWAVKEIINVDEENGVIFFEGSVHYSSEKHLYKVNLDGSDLAQLTETEGTHNTKVSPHGSYFYSEYSNINNPAKLELFNGDGKSIRVVADRRTELFDDYDLGTGELLTITTEDGYELPAMWVLPPGFDKEKKYPVIFSVYGGPEYQDVSNSFSAYLNRFFIAQSGIIYFMIDHRGSKHFGKLGASQMHRNLGKWEMHDYIEAVKWLREQPFVDETRIGIEGGSYGGYVAALGLTYGAYYFTHGIAEYAGTDWHLYDNVYTERYMDKPDENPEGYEFGSVMTHANKYIGKLLITHGMLDDNVHVQQAIQLIDVLTDLDKDFEMMFYPSSRHGVRFPKWFHAQRNKLNFWYRHFFGKECVKE